jgi:GH35 family endo-1,4-beta-xylanase
MKFIRKTNSIDLRMILIICIISFVLPFISTAQINLITNGGFENGNTGWMVWGSTLNIVTDAHSGNSAAMISNRHNSYDALAVNITGLIENGKEYRLGFWMKTPDPAVKTRATLSVVSDGQTTYRGICWNQAPATGKYIFSTETFIFSYPGKVTSVNLYFETDAVNGIYSDYIIDDIVLQEMAPDTGMMEFPGPGLKSIKSTMRIGGCATEGSKNFFTSPRAKSQLLHDCNSATVQCYPAWGRWDETRKYVYHVEEFSKRVRELKSYNIDVTAHMLAGWDQYFPDWYKNNDFEPDTLDKILKTWIEAIITYEGNDTLVDTWNVVNETQNWDGKGGYWPLYADNHNNACEFQRMGFEPDNSGLPASMIINPQHPVYIRKAFEYARMYTSKKLELRDAAIEFPTDSKYKSFYQLVVHLLKSGTPLDVIGFQTHIDLDKIYDWEGYTNNIKRYRALGLEVIIPEVDLGDTKKDWTQEKAELQKAAYYQLVTAAIRGGASDLQTWGFKDGNSGWRQDENAFPYGVDYEQKPAYFGIQEALTDMSNILFWDMEGLGSDTIPDVMTYNNFGILHNSTETGTVPGFRSNGLELDGTDDYISSRVLTDSVKGDFTLSLMLKTASGNEGVIAGLYSGDSAVMSLGLNSGGFISLNYGNSVLLTSSLPVNDDEWHLIALRRDSTEYAIFIDSSGRNTGAEASLFSFNRITAGGLDGGLLTFSGVLDEIRLYDTNIETLSYTRNLLPVAPMNLVLGSSKMIMKLSWKDLSNNEAGFIIERKIKGGDWEEVAITAENVKSYSDTVKLFSTEFSYRVRAFNKYGKSCSTLSQVKISPADPATSAGKELFSDDNDLLVIPNPVNDKFSVNVSRVKHISILTVNGSLLLDQENPQNTESLDAGMLQPGIYIVKVNDGTLIRNAKLIKQ